MPKEISGRVVSALAWDRKVRVLVAVMDGPARELARRHRLGPEAALLAAEGLVAAALLSSQLKEEERHTITLANEAPRFSLVADLWADGRLRGRFSPPEIEAVDRMEGLLAVLKFVDNREVYRGIAAVDDERLEGALQRYFTQSVQVDGRVRIQASLDRDGQISFAGGLLLERFPDLDAEEFSAAIDETLRTDFRGLMTGFAFGMLNGQEVELLEARDFRFQCTCSREATMRMLMGLGRAELREMLADPGHAEVTCNFCNEVWWISGEDLRFLLSELDADALN